MSLFVFILHILGVVVVALVLAFAQAFVTMWHLQKVTKRNEAEMAWKLGVSQSDLNNNAGTEGLDGKILSFLSEKYSNELLSNRVSDVFGIALKVWTIGGNVLELICFLVIVWESGSGKRDDIVMLWVVPVLAVIWWVLGVVFSGICSVLTGRLPGEAKVGRQLLLKV